MAADLLSEFPIGTQDIPLPRTVVLEAPFRRTIQPTTIPDRRDDIINASLGFKLTIPQRGAPRWPMVSSRLNRGGMRPDILWTVGAEYAF